MMNNFYDDMSVIEIVDIVIARNPTDDADLWIKCRDFALGQGLVEFLQEPDPDMHLINPWYGTDKFYKMVGVS